MTDIKKAMLDPTKVFTDPSEVVADPGLTRDQKIEILRRWEFDAHELEVAEEEAGMTVLHPEMFARKHCAYPNHPDRRRIQTGVSLRLTR